MTVFANIHHTSSLCFSSGILSPFILGALPPRLSAIDAKTSDWAALFTGPGAHNHQNAVEEEEPVAEEPKEPLGGT